MLSLVARGMQGPIDRHVVELELPRLVPLIGADNALLVGGLALRHAKRIEAQTVGASEPRSVSVHQGPLNQLSQSAGFIPEQSNCVRVGIWVNRSTGVGKRPALGRPLQGPLSCICRAQALASGYGHAVLARASCVLALESACEHAPDVVFEGHFCKAYATQDFWQAVACALQGLQNLGIEVPDKVLCRLPKPAIFIKDEVSLKQEPQSGSGPEDDARNQDDGQLGEQEEEEGEEEEKEQEEDEEGKRATS